MHIFYSGTFIKRGFLYGIACPIYGFGAVILILLNELISKKNNSIIIKMIIMAAVFTVFEYLVSLIFELIFGIRWWDYTNEYLNFQGRICLQFSIVWGIAGGIFIQFLYKPLQKAIKKIRSRLSANAITIIIYVLSVIILVDFILSIIKYIK